MDVLAMASLTTDLKFTGLKNTNELIETVKELFSFSNIKINVEGEISRFKADISASFSTEKDVNNFIKEYCFCMETRRDTYKERSF